ncbi:MAG: multiheme c-type cytochrome, partial [Alphaproteobacteria bacterium]|nr:multiheme c-type cytochrome [Alphaproteobacteria bacterium]
MRGRFNIRGRLRVWSLIAGFLLVAGASPAAAQYAGSESCAGCHSAEFAAWQGSHHDLAMQPANEDTVLGDFRDVRFEHRGVVTRFFRRDGRYMVETENAAGNSAEFAVAYTFGVAPLQQYLIAMPKGRYQVLTVAWDSRPAGAGGQRWFHLYPDEDTPPGDALHWTAAANNWNFTCAECHSTNLQKNYDSKTDSYATAWSEIDVACEACHGPGADHVKAATTAREGGTANNGDYSGPAIRLPGPGDWNIHGMAATATLDSRPEGVKEVEMCGRCHARRSPLTEDYIAGRSLSNSHRVELLTEDRYFPDGQVLDEVYVYGSFLQSKMHAAGVTCSDCHEPHSLQLREQGNGVCLRCHSAAQFDTAKHHFHAVDTDGAQCVDCHMPERTYMIVDPRRDHSLRIPRPDLSVDLGVPNACTGCHVDQDAPWAARAVELWYGEDRKSGFQTFARALDAGRTGAPGASDLLAALAADETAPPIARATALAQLGAYLQSSSLPAIRTGLRSDDPLLRRAAVEILEGIDRRARWQLLAPLLDDPVLSVRTALAEALADVPVDQLAPDDADRLRRVFAAYLASQQVNADRVEHWVNLGGFHARQGNVGAAEEAYAQALRLDPRFVPAYVNRADFYRGLGRSDEAGWLLRQGIKAVPDSAPLRHAYGLWLVRGGRMPEAIEALAKGWELAPDDAQMGYVYGVALNSTDAGDGAVKVWEKVLILDPNHRDTLFALVSALSDAGAFARALPHV